MGEFLKRSESVRIKCRATEEDMLLNLSKKRKVYSKLENDSCGEEELAENSVSPAVSRTSSCSKHENSTDVVKMSPSSPDLENAGSHSEGFETEISTSTGRVFREATPTSELYGDSEHVLLQQSPSTTSKKKSSPPPTALRRKSLNSVAENMPSAAELEAFFAAAEKYEQKRFAEKYNYDIVKDVPLEGKYHWVRLLP
ncbi:cyclin-dependent kinase inhibitor 7-like isoform X2 [Salvia miltiorrhiza]|uniref:cyclin-dependent kinase inhibitor 7-like isoform X2 n=1 Tax=Salvia miltiorrhiza TaxID=226208 RepID=UPI0025AC0598|nr:cyclin-dependent kinase inhibitor 7-like isoform X2 [Salvia miltiorrhiza]